MDTEIQTVSFNTPGNRARQRARGKNDALHARAFGTGNETGTLDPALDEAYRDGWTEGRAVLQSARERSRPPEPRRAER